MEIQETIIFNGIEYKLMGAKKYYLSQTKINSQRKGAKGLHCAIWEFNNKMAIPKGHCIHHKDGNTFNNNIENLECIETKLHLSEHSKNNFKNEEYRNNAIKTLRDNSDKAAEWHRSEAGLKWHSENSRNCIRKVKNLVCANCGKDFLSVMSDSKCCSVKCGDHLRREINKVSYIGKCNYCGKEFIAAKRDKSKPDNKFCSPSCTTSNRYHPKN